MVFLIQADNRIFYEARVLHMKVCNFFVRLQVRIL
jgi:hypothetical protein